MITAAWLAVRAFFGALTPLDWLISVAAAAVLTLIGVLHAHNLVLTHELKTARSAVTEAKAAAAKEHADRVNEHAAADLASAAANKKYRELEAADNARVAAATTQGVHDHEANARVIADLRHQLAGVRGQLAAFAAGTASASPDTVAACEHRASALADVLAEALRVDGELAGDAEDRAADARNLLSAWPRNGDPGPAVEVK